MELKNITLNYVLDNLKNWVEEEKVDVIASDSTSTRDGWEDRTFIEGSSKKYDLFQCPELQGLTFELCLSSNEKYVEMEVKDKEGSCIIYRGETDDFPKDFLEDFIYKFFNENKAFPVEEYPEEVLEELENEEDSEDYFTSKYIILFYYDIELVEVCPAELNSPN